MPVLPPFLSFRARVARFSLMQINISYRAQPGAFICCGRATNTGEDDVTFGFDYRRFESQINGPDEKIQVARPHEKQVSLPFVRPPQKVDWIIGS